MSAFGNGSNSNGNFWYGNSTGFPGFLYKKNVGVGGRRSTKFAAGGNITCNSSTYLYNKYKPGSNGVGASSISNRRAKNRLASVCGSSNKCFPCFNTLGQYNSYTGNPNGFIPCPNIPTSNLPIYIFPPFTTTGGSTVTYTDSTYVITFTTNGTMTFLENVSIPTTVNYLFVGGGGGGGGNPSSSRGGGGGAGGQVKYFTNVFGATPTMTLTFTVAVAPTLVTGVGANGNPTICSGPGISTITSDGGLVGGTSVSFAVAVGGVGSSGGGSGGNGGAISGAQGTSGSPGSSYIINGIQYFFGGGGAGGNNGTGNLAGGRGGGGGSGTGINGNNAVNPYTGPNGISQAASAAGYINSGGGGAGCNGGNNFSNRAGSSGIVVVWFSYP
jgi:hypothetical protein